MSSGSIRFMCRGRFSRMVARAPSTARLGTTPSVSASMAAAVALIGTFLPPPPAYVRAGGRLGKAAGAAAWAGAPSGRKGRRSPRMADLPQRVEIAEEGPREGFQIEPGPIPTADKIALIDALAATGLRHIQICSFVRSEERRVGKECRSRRSPYH